MIKALGCFFMLVPGAVYVAVIISAVGGLSFLLSFGLSLALVVMVASAYHFT